MDNKEIIYELINGISSSKKVQLRDDTNLLDTQILDSLGIAQLVAGLEANLILNLMLKILCRKIL